MPNLLSSAAPVALIAGLLAGQEGAPNDVRVETRQAPFHGFRPQAVVDARGVLHVVQGDTTSRGDVYYTRRERPDGPFSQRVRVNSIPGVVAAFRMAVGPGGRVHVLVRPNPKYSRRMMPEKQKLRIFDLRYMLYTRLTEAGDAFEPERDISGPTIAFEGMGVILAGADGVVRAYWHGQLEPKFDETSRRIYAAVSRDGGATFGPPAPVDAAGVVGTCQCCSMAGALGPDGSIYLGFRNSRPFGDSFTKDSHLLVSRDGGETFEASLLEAWPDAGCPGSTGSLAATATGAWVAWETRGKVRVASTPDAAARIDAPGDAHMRTPLLVADDRGRVLVVWTEVLPKQRGAGDVRWRLHDASGELLDEGVARRGTAAGWGAPGGFVEPDGCFVILLDGEGPPQPGVIR